MPHPQLISRRANLPPNVGEENAFAYQTNTPPYHFNTSTAYQNLTSYNDIEDYIEDDTPFDVSDSEDENGEREREEEEEEEEEEEIEISISVAEEEAEVPIYSRANTNRINRSLYLNNINNSDAIAITPNLVASTLTATTTTTTIPTTATTSNSPRILHHSNSQNENSISQEFVVNSSRTCHTQSFDSSNSCEEVLSNPARPALGEDYDVTDNPSNNVDCSPYYSDYISNEGQDSTSEEDFFDNCNAGDDSDASRPAPSLSYRFLSDEGMSSDENEQENAENETNANDWVICEEMDF